MLLSLVLFLIFRLDFIYSHSKKDMFDDSLLLATGLKSLSFKNTKTSFLVGSDHQLTVCCYATVKQVCAVCQSLTFWCHLVTTCTQKTSNSFFLIFFLFSVNVGSTGWVNSNVSCGYATFSVRVRCRDKKSLLSFVAGSRLDSALIYTRQ